MKSSLLLTLTGLLVASATPALGGDTISHECERPNPDYLVVSLVAEHSSYFEAAQVLAERHSAEIVTAKITELDEFENRLAQRPPRIVAFVIQPSDLEVNTVERILLMATRMDSDPFVDFEYGFITGRDGAAAVKLVEASTLPKYFDEPTISLFGVGSKQMGKSRKHATVWPLRNGTLPVNSLQSIGETDETRDTEFIESSLPEMDGAPILLLASHGYPDGLVGGVKAADIRGRDFEGSVALNIACYNGVTSSWYEDDWSTMTVKRRKVDAEDSFCLQMIDNGVAAYIAYVTPRPAGPTMFGDAIHLASNGKSVGELQKESANSIVLAHLLTGDQRLNFEPVVDGQAIERNRLPGDIVKRMSTGGILVGDPAFKPFAGKEDSDPCIQSVENTNDRTIVTTTIKTPLHHMHTSEPINYWEKKSAAVRLETVVPLGQPIGCRSKRSRVAVHRISICCGDRTGWRPKAIAIQVNVSA